MLSMICKRCGKQFKPKAHNQLYCHKKGCGWVIKCKICGKKFKSNRIDKVTCSKPCESVLRKDTKRRNVNEITFDTKLMLVESVEGRRKQTLEQVAKDLFRDPKQMRQLHDQMKTNGEWQKFKNLLSLQSEISRSNSSRLAVSYKFYDITHGA